MSYIPLPKQLKNEHQYEKVKNEVLTEAKKNIHKFPDPLSLDISIYLATLIENLVFQKGNKMLLLFEILQILFTKITADDLRQIQNNVESLLRQKVIVKIPLLVKYVHLSYELISRVFKKSC